MPQNDVKIRNSNPKDDFTVVSNKVLRSKELSPIARFLYMFIRSYITLQGFDIYKNYIKKETTLKNETFDRAWKELKDKGYLVQYKTCGNRGQFKYEYELLLEPQVDNNDCAEPYAEKPPYGKNLPHGGNLPYGGETTPWLDHSVVQPSNGKPPIYNNTYLSNTEINKTNQSFKEPDEDKKALIKKDLAETHRLSQLCTEDKEALAYAIKYLSKLDTGSNEAYYNDPIKQTAMDNCVSALIAMAIGKCPKYNPAAIIQKISDTLQNDDNHDLFTLFDVVSRQYINYCAKQEIDYPIPYIQSILYNGFDTYRIQYQTEVKRVT